MNIFNFNNIFALWITAITAGIWVLDGRGIIDIDDKVLGALIPVWTLIAQYYFRKAQKEST